MKEKVGMTDEDIEITNEDIARSFSFDPDDLIRAEGSNAEQTKGILADMQNVFHPNKIATDHH